MGSREIRPISLEMGFFVSFIFASLELYSHISTFYGTHSGTPYLSNMKFSYKGWCNASKARADGKAPIYVRIRHGKNVARVVSLNKSIEPEHFDNSSGYPVKSYRTASHLKRVIDNKLREIEDVINDFERNGRLLTLDTLINLVAGYGESFFEFAKHELEREKKKLSDKTYNNHDYFLESVRKYQPNLKIADVTTDWLNDFKYYLTNVKGRRPNGAAQEFKTMSKFINVALKKGIIKVNPFLDFRKPAEKTEIEYLLPEELDALVALWRSGKLSPRLAATAWYFMIGCYTGNRYKDVYELSLKMKADPQLADRIIHSGRLSLKTSKSGYKKTSSVSVDHFSLLLKNVPDRPMKQSNSRVNSEVRDLLQMVGVTRHLTFHSSRHTFAVISKIYGIDTDVLREILTHSDIRITHQYAKIADRLKDDEMKKWPKQVG